jgi:eukaryotic-like serine/threonine-protein kinase
MSSERDLLVARICIEKGFATAEQVQECLEAPSSGAFEFALRQKGYISDEALREIARMTPPADTKAVRTPAEIETLKRCAACGTVYSGEACSSCLARFAQDTGEEPTPEELAAGDAAISRERAGEALPPEVAQAEKNPANRFGKFVLVRQLGAGGMGVVFQAWQTDLRRMVALKFIRGAEAEKDLERFTREARLAATLSHPAIAPIYESGEIDGKHYFAMQFVEGVTLDRVLAAKPRPAIRRGVEILVKVAEAVEYAHEHGIIHRDLKPANVMVDARDRVYVMDFGLAKLVRTGSSLTGSGFAVGTPSYMSPEQAQGDHARIGPRSDVYALGALLYEVSAARPPFTGDNVVQLLVDVVHKDPVPPRRLNPKVHPELETVTLKALEKDPDRRYASAAELTADLRRWLDGEPVLARPAGTVSRLVRRLRKHKLATAGVLAMVAGLAIVAAMFGFRAREERTRSAARPHYETAAAQFDAADKLRLLSKAPPESLARYGSMLERAEEQAARAVERDPLYAEAHYLLGRILRHRTLELGRADAELTRAIELEPGHLRAYLERALLRLDLFAVSQGLQTVSLRNTTLSPTFTWAEGDARFTKRRERIGQDLDTAGRLAGREYEKSILQGAAEFALWRPGQNEQLDKAERHFLRARELSPADPFPFRFLAWVRLARGDARGAGDYAARAVEVAPNDHPLLYHAACMLSYGGRQDEALVAVERALLINPEHSQLLNVKGNILTRKGDFAGAAAVLEKAHARDPRQATVLDNLGYALFQLKRFKEAASTYGRAAELDPEDWDAFEGRALSLMELGRFDEAEKDMGRVVAGRPTADSYSNRGAVRSRAGRYDDAMADFREALRLDPDNQEYPYNVGILRSREGKDAEAVESLRRAEQLGRKRVDTYVALAQALNRLKRYPEGESAATRALDLDPGSTAALADRGQARAEQGKIDLALADYLKAVSLKPDHAGAHRDLGITYMKTRRPAEALPHLQRAVELGRKDISPLLAEALNQLGRPEEAEKAFSEAVAALPRDPMALFGRSRVRHALGRRAEAIADLDAALVLAPGFAEAWGYRGVLKLEEKRRADAAADLRKALELKPSLRQAFGAFLEDAAREE